MNTHKPFNIQILVAEGLPDGLRIVEKSNWIGRGVICPRSRYTTAKKRPEFSFPGVYILVGHEIADHPTIYIGESETVRDRLDSHYAKKDFWQQAIIFTTADGKTLNKAKIQHLEACLCELAEKNKRCHLDNGNQPNYPILSEAEKVEIDGYLDEMLLLLPVLGIDVFKSAESVVSGDRIHYHCVDKANKWKASGYETGDGFLVEAGSLARLKAVNAIKHVRSYYNKREQLIDEGILVESNGNYRLKIDQIFSSPSQAASVFAGKNANGGVEWKDEKGTTLRDHREREAKNQS